MDIQKQDICKRLIKFNHTERGGARVIYDLRPTRHEIWLIIVYPKAKFDNLRPEFLLKLKGRVNGKR